MGTNLEIGATFNDEELSKAITDYMEGCDVSMEHNRQHLVSVLYMTLCVAGSDGLGEAEISKFYTVTDKMGFKKEESDKILKTYQMECNLIASFNDIYDPK